jgi:hypothetical protein
MNDGLRHALSTEPILAPRTEHDRTSASRRRQTELDDLIRFFAMETARRQGRATEPLVRIRQCRSEAGYEHRHRHFGPLS